MSDDFAIRERITPPVHGNELGGELTGAGNEVLILPDTIRDPQMRASAPLVEHGAVVNSAPFSAAAIALHGEVARVVDGMKQRLRLGDGDTALKLIGSLSRQDRPSALEAIGPDLLTKMEAKLSRSVRSDERGLIQELRNYRNAAFNPPDQNQFVGEASRKLRGFFEHSWVSEGNARALIDGLRRFDPKTQDAILDELGPGRTQWLVKGLSKLDREIYEPTVRTASNTHFGAIARSEAARGLAPQDVTARFEHILAEVEAGRMKLDPEKHGKVTYYFVPGLATEHQPGYFEPNMQRLKERGLKVVMSKLDTDADMATNSATIKGEMRELSGGKADQVFVVSHSKGGPDARMAMLDPEIDRLGFFWDAIQSACGTPVSSTLMEGAGPLITRVFKDVFGAPNGNALKDLDFKTQKALWIGSRAIETPILSFATETGAAAGPLSEIAKIIERRYGKKSDGLVPEEEQLIGGVHAFAVRQSGFDHAAPVYRPLPGARPKHDPADLQEARILLAFELEAMLAT